jgi:hypothetical protein
LPTFRACRFLGNISDGNGGGAGVTNGEPNFLNCVFSGNDCDDDGGGLWIQDDSIADPLSDVGVINCTFANNTVGGSGRSIYNGEEITLRNSICWSTSGSGAQVAAAGGASSTTSENNIEGEGGSANPA